MKWSPVIQKIDSQSGFSIVEILVFTVIFGLVIIGVMSMIRSGRQMEVESDYHRQARALIHGILENQDYSPLKYNILGGNPGTETDTTTLDPGNNPVSAIVTVTVDAEANTVISGSNVPYIGVTAKVVWQESDGSDSLSVTKRVAQVKN